MRRLFASLRRGFPPSETYGADQRAALDAASDKMRLWDLMELPEILRGRSRGEFFVHVAQLLRLAVDASWCRVLRAAGEVLATDSAEDVAGGARVSRRLTERAVGAAPKAVLHCWEERGGTEATATAGLDWAVAAAALIPGESPVVFYAAGRGEVPKRRQEENARFIGLVADMVGRTLSVAHLQNWQGRLERYFSGPVIGKILASNDPKDLEPKIVDGTVLFFDIRNFSRMSEGRQEQILAYQAEIRSVMTAMADEVFKEHGVVLQFMGDGMLACWNLPYPDPGHVAQACRAALGPGTACAVRVGRYVPAGMESVLELFELLPPGGAWPRATGGCSRPVSSGPSEPTPRTGPRPGCPRPRP